MAKNVVKATHGPVDFFKKRATVFEIGHKARHEE